MNWGITGLLGQYRADFVLNDGCEVLSLAWRTSSFDRRRTGHPRCSSPSAENPMVLALTTATCVVPAASKARCRRVPAYVDNQVAHCPHPRDVDSVVRTSTSANWSVESEEPRAFIRRAMQGPCDSRRVTRSSGPPCSRQSPPASTSVLDQEV